MSERDGVDPAADSAADPTADTGSFQAFADDDQPRDTSATAFRVVSLLVGLVVFAGLVALLLLI